MKKRRKIVDYFDSYNIVDWLWTLLQVLSEVSSYSDYRLFERMERDIDDAGGRQSYDLDSSWKIGENEGWCIVCCDLLKHSPYAIWVDSSSRKMHRYMISLYFGVDTSSNIPSSLLCYWIGKESWYSERMDMEWHIEALRCEIGTTS